MELFFHHKASPFVRKVLLGIIELGVDAVDRAIDFSSTEAMQAYAQINPNRRFPALRDGELVLWESNAILRHLARRTPWLGQTDRLDAMRARPSWQATERMKQETLAAFNIKLPTPRHKMQSSSV